MKAYTFTLLLVLIIPNIFGQIVGRFEIDIKESSIIDLKVEILRKENTLSGKSDSCSLRPFIILPIPLTLSKEFTFEAAPDVNISVISKGSNYTILLILAPESEIVKFTIRKGVALSENPEGKSELRFDPTFPTISKPERDLFELYNTVKEISFIINHEIEYSDTEVVWSSNNFTKTSSKTYSSSDIKLNGQNQNEVWLVFPNASNIFNRNYRFLTALLIGLLSLLLYRSLKISKRPIWYFGVFFFSIIVGFLILFFVQYIAKSSDDIGWAAIALPHSLYGFVLSIYYWLSSRYQSVLTGKISLDGLAAKIAVVQLLKLANDNSEELVRVNKELEENGRYTFSIWQKKGKYKYIIKAKTRYSEEGVSKKIEIERGKKIEVPPIKLKSLEIIDEEQLNSHEEGAN